MARRSPGEGSIFQREDGRWVAALTLDGRRRSIYGATRKEAAQKLADLKRQVGAGGLPDPGKRTVADLLDKWLETAAPGLKPRTLANYHKTCERYILPALGSVRLSRLSPDRLQSLYSGLQAQGHDRTAQQVHNTLHHACKLAVLWRWLPENPCDRVIRPTYHAERKQMWTAEELAAFLAGTKGHWLQPVWLVALASGCRLGELSALTWADADLAAGSTTVSIAKTGQHIGGEWTVTAPKTKAGERTISLPPEGMAALRHQRAQQAEWHLRAGPEWVANNLVFTGKTGKPLQGTVVAHALTRVCRRLGLPEVTPHGLRHLHASLLLAEGLPITDVAKRLGHAHAGVTLAVYSHAIGSHDARAAEAIGRALAAR